MNENPVKRRGGLAAVFVVIAMMCDESIGAAPSCESLMSLSLPRTSITSAQVVGAGAFAPARGVAGAAQHLTMTPRAGLAFQSKIRVIS